MLTPQKHKFSLPDNLVYFNMAYMAPLLRVAEVQGMEGLLKKRNPTLLGHEHFFEDVERLKSTFGKLITAPAHQVAVIPSVSYGIANAAKNLEYKSGGEIICLDEQFPSNYYPWQRAAKDNDQTLKMIPSSNSSEIRVSGWNDNICAAINTNTTAVCLGHVHWADGSLFDLERISKLCQEHNAYLIIDGTQSVGALPIDVEKLNIDVLIVGGYKWLLGHYGLGMAYYSEKFNEGTPIEDNWINKQDSENFQGLVNYKDQYKSGAAKYSVGEQSNFVHVPMLQAGLEQILEWGVEEIQAYGKTLHLSLIEGLKGSAYKVAGVGDSSSHLTSIRLSEGMDMDKIKKILLDNNIYVSYRGEAMRVSFYVYNTEEEVQRMVEVLLGVV